MKFNDLINKKLLLIEQDPITGGMDGAPTPAGDPSAQTATTGAAPAGEIPVPTGTICVTLKEEDVKVESTNAILVAVTPLIKPV